MPNRLQRRRFLAAASTLVGSLAARAFGAGRDGPPVAAPRATDGDVRREPDWDERLTVTVGAKEGDLVGQDDKVLQAACDYVARVGGGTVQILPGVYTLRNSVYLPAGVRLRGSGADSIITKIASETIKLAEDSDWYDQEITLEKPAGFRVGDGVTLRAANAHHGGQEVIKRTLIARSGSRFKLNDGLRKNLWLSGEPTCASLFPLLTSEYTANVVIEDLTLDGNRANNDRLDGNYAGCVFLQDCRDYTIRNVTARNYNGDGISFQICHDVIVEGCHSHDNADLGVHPGSGSQRPIVRNCRMEKNTIGLFWCWGVRHGLAEDNRMEANTSYGISIGHCDTDNAMRRNQVSDSGEVGVLFRDDARGKDFWPNRNLLEKNRIVNSGDAQGVGIEILGRTRDLRIFGNVIEERREPLERTGIRIERDVGKLELADNRIEGFAKAVDDRRVAAG